MDKRRAGRTLATIAKELIAGTSPSVAHDENNAAAFLGKASRILAIRRSGGEVLQPCSLSPSVIAALLMLILITIGACGGGSEDQQEFRGDIVPLTAILNGQAATGNMTLALDQRSPIPNAIDYQVLSFNLFSEQLRLSGQGSVNTITFDRRITLTIDARFEPQHSNVHLSGQGIADSILPLRFTDLRIAGDGVEVLLSTD